MYISLLTHVQPVPILSTMDDSITKAVDRLLNRVKEPLRGTFRRQRALHLDEAQEETHMKSKNFVFLSSHRIHFQTSPSFSSDTVEQNF